MKVGLREDGLREVGWIGVFVGLDVIVARLVF